MLVRLKLDSPAAIRSDLPSGISPPIPSFWLLQPSYLHLAAPLALSAGLHLLIAIFFPILFGLLLSDRQERVSAILVRMERTPLILRFPEEMRLSSPIPAPRRSLQPKPAPALPAPAPAPAPTPAVIGTASIVLQPDSLSIPLPPEVKIPAFTSLKKFALTPAATAPARMVDAPALPDAGPSLAILSISPDLPKPGDTILVPPGNRSGPLGSSAASAAAAAAAATAATDSLARSITTRGAAQTPFHQIAGDSPANAVGAADPSSSAAAGAAEGSASNLQAPPSAGANGANAAFPVPSDARIVSFPAGGDFDVVVLQSGAELVPGVEGVLSGHLIYTVYINIGWPKEWILQYCLPEDPAGPQGMVISVGAPAKLEAPFIRTAVLPPDSPPRFARFLIYHGALGADGHFQNLRLVRGGPAGAALLPFLTRWEFRPARRDGAPTNVEVLLAIPPSS